MEKREFLLEHLFWTICLLLAYQNALFRCLEDFTFQESLAILLGMIFLSGTVGILLELEHNRTPGSIFANLMFGFGPYTICIYLPVHSVWFTVIFCAALLLALAYILVILCRRIANQSRKHLIRKQRIRRAAVGAHRIFGAAFGCMLFICIIPLLFGNSLIWHTNNIRGDNQEEETIANHAETLSQFQENVWDTLSVQKKLYVLQTAANVERHYLGISNELNVGTANLDGNLVAVYIDNTHEILFDLDFLLYESSWDMLEALCHEAYHSYQYQMVSVYTQLEESSKNLKLFRNAKIYEQEFQNYKDGNRNFNAYYEQKCEIDARAYAKSALSDYQTKIEQYLATKEKSNGMKSSRK